MTLPRWRLTKPLRDRIDAGHPWIYDRALAPPRGLAPGDIATVVDDDGPVATVLADPSSPLRARVLDREPDVSIDAGWVRSRVRAAGERRVRDPLLHGVTGVRLVHGEADGCPGLVIDLYDTTAVVVFDGAAASVMWRGYLEDVLVALDDAGHQIEHAWVRGDRKAHRAGSEPGRGAEAVRGRPPDEIVIAEDEARFGVDVRHGQKTGFFLDQRDNRRTVRRHASGASVLNVFSYTGGFSVHAALGGARHVTSVDIASPAIAEVGRNLERSGVDAGMHEGVAQDAFEFLARAQQRGRRWDLVIVDPPSFAPSEQARSAALGAYRKLVGAALAVVEPAGRFALASCSSHITEADLLDVAASFHEVGLRVRHVAGAASDHPVLPAFPEGRYLKFLLFDLG